MKLSQGMEFFGEGRPELQMNPWVLAQIIQQGEVLQKTGAEFQQFLEQKMQDGLFSTDSTSDATKFDGLKGEAIATDLEEINPLKTIEQLKKSDLSQEAIDIFLEVLAEKCIKFGKTMEAAVFADAIENPEIKLSIKEQVGEREEAVG